MKDRTALWNLAQFSHNIDMENKMKTETKFLLFKASSNENSVALIIFLINWMLHTHSKWLEVTTKSRKRPNGYKKVIWIIWTS